MAKTAQTTILLVEDSPTDVRLIKELLLSTSSDSFRVITASTLAQGLQLLSANSVDAILLDLGLPDSQGIDTFRAVHEHASHLPTIVLTISGDEALGQRVLQEGALRFLSKDALTLGTPYAGIFTRMIRFSIEQKRTQAALAESEREYRNLVHNLNALVLRVDPQQHITFANDYALSLLGYTPQEFVGHHVVGTLLPPTESTGRDLEQMANDVLTRPERYEHNRNEVIAKDGRRLWIEWTNTPQYDEDGVYTGVLATGIDVTEQIKTEDALSLERHRSQRYLDLIDLAQDAIVVRDLDHRAITWNKGAERLFGWTAEQAIGKRVPDLIHVVFPVPFEEVHATLLKEGHWKGAVECRARDGTPLIVEHRFTLTRDKTGKLARILSISYDVTAQRQAEEALQQAHEEVQVLNEGLKSANEKLRVANEELEQRVQERTEELAAKTASLEESEARYRQLLQESFDGVLIHSGGVIQLANEAAVRILKAPSHEALVGMEILDLLAPQYRTLGRERIAKVYETGQSSTPAELQFNAHDGTIVDVEVLGTRITYKSRPALYVVFRDIGERKRMEAQLKQYAEQLEDLVEERTAQLAQSEEYFRTLFETSSIAQLRYNVEGIAIRVNNAAKEFLGIQDVSDVQSLSIWGSPRISEEDKARLREEHAIHYEQVYDFAAIRDSGQFLTTRSDVRYAEIYILPLFSASDNTVEGYFAQVVDITERKGVEASLAKSEEQYRTLIETASSLIFTLDTEGTITYVNDYGARSLGYTPDELIGQNVMIIVPETDSSGRNMTPYIDDIVAHPDTHSVSINENVTKDGRRLWFNWINKTLTDEHGRHIGHLAIGNDVTEQLRVQRALQDSEEQYRTLVETAHSIILMVDSEGSITFINDYGAHFFGYTPDELVGKHAMILVPSTESTGRDLTALIDDIVAHPDEHSVSLNENITKDGRRVLINWVNHILTDKEGHHLGHLTMGYDVTEQKRAEDALRDAQRLAGIGQTAAMIGHDLRNPLQGLQYIVDLQKLRFDRIPPAERSTEDWEKEQALFDRISEQVFYMDKIVGDLQDYARPLEPEHATITIDTLINDVLESLPHADNVTIVSNIGDLTIEADPHLMHRVFANLLLNAMQAMPKGGTLTVGAKATDGFASIDVSDTGIGIAADMRDKIFSPLTTGKAKGTGLGLAVVKRIVEAHRGTITFESEEGKGTTFTVTLPQTAERFSGL